VKKIAYGLFICAAIPNLSAQVTGNVISRVLEIRYNGFSGTAFLVDYANKPYLVTANHMVETAGNSATVEVLGANDSLWHPIPFTILHGSSPCVDVAVLVSPDLGLTGIDPLPYDYNFAMGQEAYFLGFPFGLYTAFKGKNVAVPLIKHGYISASVPCSAIYPGGSADDNLILLDGINNHGFSGGPVVGPDVFDGTRALKLVGVISGYKNEDVPVDVNGQSIPNVSGEVNSGIILVIPISRAIDLIKDYVAKETPVGTK
jgi:S1-C subfamily serine protease